MEVPWLLTVLIMFNDIPHGCPIIKNLAMDVYVDQMIKGLQSVHLTFDCSEMCVVQIRVLILDLSGGGLGDEHVQQRFTCSTEKNGPDGVLKRT